MAHKSESLHYLIHFIRQSYQEFCKLRLEKLINPKTLVPIDVNGIGYIDNRIVQDINKYFPYGEQHHVEFCGIDTKIVLAGADAHLSKFLLFYTCFLIYMFKVHVGKLLTSIDITLICYDGKKHLPDDQSTLGPFEINGGVTMTQGDHAEIVVYRYEEIVKVLTHEMIHAFGLDAKHISANDESFVNEYFNLMTSMTCKSATLNESFTDALACFINAVMYTNFLRIPEEKFVSVFLRNMEKERRHVFSQAQKVLMFNGYKSPEGQLHNDAPICEKTHVTSYFVIKSVVYEDLLSFYKMIASGRLCIDVSQYINLIKRNLKWFAKKISLENKLRLKSKSLKMSSLDILELYRGVKTI